MTMQYEYNWQTCEVTIVGFNSDTALKAFTDTRIVHINSDFSIPLL